MVFRYTSGKKGWTTSFWKGYATYPTKLAKSNIPRITSITKVTPYSKAFTVKWDKKKFSGYQVRYSTKSSMGSSKTVTVKGYKNTSKKIKSLKAHKKYYVQVRTYKTYKGKKYYSKWSAKKSVVTK